MNRKTFCIRFLIAIFIIILPQVTYAQQVCRPVETCVVTSVAGGQEARACWYRIECTGSPTGVTLLPLQNSSSGGAPSPSGSNGSAASAVEQEQKKKACLTKAIDKLAACKKKVNSDHQYVSAACNAYKWSGAAVGVIAAWAAIDDLRSGVVVGAAAVALERKSEACEQRIGREREGRLDDCDIKKMRDDLACG